MALLTIEGVYREGSIELCEVPAGVREARVMVVFLPANGAKGPSIGPDSLRERHRQAAFAQMRQGIDLGGPPYPRREELYDRT